MNRVHETDSAPKKIHGIIPHKITLLNTMFAAAVHVIYLSKNVFACACVLVVNIFLLFGRMMINNHCLVAYAYTNDMRGISFIFLVLLLFMPANDITWKRSHSICLFLE